jgi:hypothetical protein
VPDEDKKRALYRELIDHVVNGDGHTPAEERGRAFRNRGLPRPLDVLIDKVARKPALVTDADIAAAREAGWTEDQLLELITCAAAGQSARQYQAGMAALGAATGARALGSGTPASGRPGSAA